MSVKVPIYERPSKVGTTPSERKRVGFFSPKFADFSESIVFGKSAQIVYFESSKRASYLASWKDARLRAERKMRKNSPNVLRPKQVSGPHIRRFANLFPWQIARRSFELCG
jgi:hypothetical protein